MKLQLVDVLIIAAYLVIMIVIGLLLKKKASKNLDSYFLGGKTLPFYMLGLSNASGMFDISGTMWMVYLAFVYGLKSLWIPWLWPVFNQIFLMIYLSIWLRRSNVLTGAEWIRTRFGYGRGANLSHTIVVLYAVIGVLGFLSYGFIGIGKFMEIFFPWEVVSQYVPFDVAPQYVPHVYGIFFTTIATLYVMLGDVEYCMDRRGAICYNDGCRCGDCCYRNDERYARDACRPCAGWMGFSFLWLDAGSGLEQSVACSNGQNCC